MSSIRHIPSPPRAALTPKHAFKRGDLVASAEPEYPLRSSLETYGRAVVVQANPLVLVSERCDMRWESGALPRKLRGVGTATPAVLARCIARL